MVRPFTHISERLRWRILRPLSTLEQRMICYALKHRKAGEMALISHLNVLGAEIIVPLGDHQMRIAPDSMGKKSYAMEVTNGTFSNLP